MITAYFCCCLAPSLKVSHPTEVVLSVEADARPLKKTGHKQKANAASRGTDKNKTVPTVSRNNTKDGRRNVNTVKAHSPSKSLAGKTVSTASVRHVNAGQVTPMTSSSRHHSEDVPDKATPAVSRNHGKVVTHKAIKGGDSPTAHAVTSVKKFNTVQSKSKSVEPQTLSTNKATKESKSKKSKDANNAVSARRISTTPAVAKTFSTKSFTKQSQFSELLISPTAVNRSAHSVTTVASSSALHSLKKPSLAKIKTDSFIQARSEAAAIAVLNSTVEQKASTQVISQGKKTNHHISSNEQQTHF